MCRLHASPQPRGPIARTPTGIVFGKRATPRSAARWADRPSAIRSYTNFDKTRFRIASPNPVADTAPWTRVETGSHDRRVAHPTGEHEGGPARGGARGEAAPAVAGHRAHGASELNGLPLAGIAGHPALANLGQAFPQTTTGFRGCRIIPDVPLVSGEGRGVGPDEQDMRRAEHIPGDADGIFHLFDGGDASRFE